MKLNDVLLAHDCYSDMYYFLQVTKVTAKTVTARRIYASRRTGQPLAGEFNEDYEPVTKRVNDGRISLGTWTGARVWNGEPLHNVHPLFGVNYNLY